MNTAAAVLPGTHIDYPLRRIHELCGSLVVDLDVVASLDAAIDALCARENRELPGDEVLRLVPYFGTLWPAGRALAHWLGERPSVVRGRRIVEVACGLGLPAIVAARLGGHVHACDAHPDVAPLLRRNAALNDVVVAYHRVDVVDLDAIASLGEFDVVLASDVVYEAVLADHVAPALARLCRPGGKIVLADPGRPLLQRAVNALEALGFVGELETRRARRADDPAAAGGAGEQDVFLMVFTRT